MLGIKVIIERFVDDWQPGWAECSLIDALGVRHVFIEKGPIVSAENLISQTEYPRDGCFACTMVSVRVEGDRRKIATVDTSSPWGIESIAGISRFEVLPEQMIELGSDPHGAL